MVNVYWVYLASCHNGVPCSIWRIPLLSIVFICIYVELVGWCALFRGVHRVPSIWFSLVSRFVQHYRSIPVCMHPFVNFVVHPHAIHVTCVAYTRFGDRLICRGCDSLCMIATTSGRRIRSSSGDPAHQSIPRAVLIMLEVPLLMLIVHGWVSTLVADCMYSSWVGCIVWIYPLPILRFSGTDFGWCVQWLCVDILYGTVAIHGYAHEISWYGCVYAHEMCTCVYGCVCNMCAYRICVQLPSRANQLTCVLPRYLQSSM
jgi:hypothetical protein